jgi:hypothetical protein
MRIEATRGSVNKMRVERDGAAEIVRIIRAPIGEIEIASTISEGEIPTDNDAPAVSIVRGDGVVAVLVEDIVSDIDPIQRLPKDDAIGAVVGHDVVIDLEIANGAVARDLQTARGVGNEHIIEDKFILAAKVQSVIEIAAGTPVVINTITHVAIAGRPFIRVNAIPSVGVRSRLVSSAVVRSKDWQEHAKRLTCSIK